MTTSILTKETFFSQFPIFQGLSLEDKERIENLAELRVKQKYAYIYQPGDPTNEIYFLAKGTIKISTHSDDGKEVIKTLIHPTAMFGEIALIGEKKHNDFAQALKEEVHVYALKVSDFKRVMNGNLTLSERVMELFGSRLRSAESKLESLIFKDARSRIIDFIKDSVNKRGRRIGYEMLLKHSLTHQDIANITCTSRQTVTLVLNELRKSDLIYFNRGKILVRDMAKLA